MDASIANDSHYPRLGAAPQSLILIARKLLSENRRAAWQSQPQRALGRRDVGSETGGSLFGRGGQAYNGRQGRWRQHGGGRR
jgi:hypothetical protein